MNIYRIFVKEIKQNLRNVRALAMMILFPIVLMLVLGTALSGVFDSSNSFQDISVIYINQGGAPLSEAFNAFVARGSEMGLKFTSTENKADGLEGITNGRYACFIEVSKTSVGLYKNARYGFKANLAEGLLNTFLQRYNALAAIAKVQPQAVGRLAVDQNFSFVSSTSITGQKQPRAMDYFAVTMLTLIVLYSSMTGAAAIYGERTAKTGNRLLCSPLSRRDLLIGKLLGALVVTMLQVMVVVLFSKYVLHTYWGNHLGIVLAVVAAEIAMAVSLGLGMVFILKNETSSKGILNMLIPLVAFFGGNYMPVDAFSETMQQLTNLSPLRWVNKAIFGVVYNNDFSSVGAAILINLAIAAVFVAISSLAIRKEAF